MPKYRATINYSKIVEAEDECDAMAQIEEAWREEVDNADQQEYIEVEELTEEKADEKKNENG